ncbi:MAG: ABC transporter permease [Bacteroidetes bacterium]|nr:ABC transporter permease [Bacteroidota bacterium]MCL5738743.1 ABC transporter permease [Bacteroidota bacterium]
MNKNFIISEWSESFLMALAAIKSNKLRSILTLLGIVIGVFSIIAVTTAMRVLQNSIETELNSLGSNVFVVQKFPAFGVHGPAEWAKYRNRKDLTYEQALQVKQRATLAKSVGVLADKFGKIVEYQDQKTNPNVSLYGVTPDIFPAQNWNIAEGRAISQSDLETGRLVCVLDPNLVKTLFPHSDPLGAEVQLDGIGYRVVGAIKDQGNVLGGGQPYMVVPITTFFARYGKERSLDIYVQALTQKDLSAAQEQVEGILRAVRKVPPGKDDDFEMVSNESMIGQFNSITFYVRIGAIVVSAIALLAAGVGIMNIMLVGVTERTREIGVRKSVGATKRNILTQFLLEAIVLCEVGGVVGVLLGLIGGNLAALALHLQAAFPLDWAIIGLVVCSLVGIIFGVYPAYKAASVDPIESLRYE